MLWAGLDWTPDWECSLSFPKSWGTKAIKLEQSMKQELHSIFGSIHSGRHFRTSSVKALNIWKVPWTAAIYENKNLFQPVIYLSEDKSVKKARLRQTWPPIPTFNTSFPKDCGNSKKVQHYSLTFVIVRLWVMINFLNWDYDSPVNYDSPETKRRTIILFKPEPSMHSRNIALERKTLLHE